MVVKEFVNSSTICRIIIHPEKGVDSGYTRIAHVSTPAHNLRLQWNILSSV